MSNHLRLVSSNPEDVLAATHASLSGQAGKAVLTLVISPPPCEETYNIQAQAPRAASGRPLPLMPGGWFRTLPTQGRKHEWVAISKAMSTACERMRTAYGRGNEPAVEMALREFDALAWEALATSTLRFGDFRERVRLIAHLLGCRDSIGSAISSAPSDYTEMEWMFALLNHELYRLGRDCDFRDGKRSEKARAIALENREQIRAAGNDD